MSHDSITRSVFGVTHATLVARILRVLDKATPADIEAGARWYSEQQALAESLAGYDDGNSRALTIEHTASVIAALSPRCQWSRNVEAAVLLVKTGEHLPGIMAREFNKAQRALTEGFDVFGPSAPKTGRFARNIAGDTEAVTVDVWAMRVVGLDEDLLSRKGAYDAVEHAYRLAARRAGLEPSTIQATTWIVARGGRAA